MCISCCSEEHLLLKLEKGRITNHILSYDDEESALNQYFVCIEQELMMETSNIIAAVFFCVSAYYIFNLSYHKKAGSSYKKKIKKWESLKCIPL